MVLQGLRLGTARRRLAAALLGAGLALTIVPAASAIELSRLDAAITASDGSVERRAGAHPDVNVGFDVPIRDPADPLSGPVEQPHRFRVDLPPGLVGDPSAAERCPVAALKAGYAGLNALCPVGAQVGVARVLAAGSPISVPVYNVVPPSDRPAMFAFNVIGVVVRIVPRVRADDYGITLETETISQALQLNGADVRLWGVPADPIHDAERYAPVGTGSFVAPPAASQAPRRPFLSLGTSCAADGGAITARVDGWRSIGADVLRTIDTHSGGVPFANLGCEGVEFEPTATVAATSTSADAPSGLTVDVRVPQESSPDGRATGHVRDVALELPEGMSVSPSAAAGLGACTPEQVGVGADGPAACPSTSRLGTVSVRTPLLDEPMTGAIHLATPDRNPFGSLLAMYLVAEGPGVRIKLPGRIDADPVSGRLTATFANAPQLPFSALTVHLDGGPNAPLATPAACGRYAATTRLTSWSGRSVARTSPIAIDRDCGPHGFAPGVTAGSASTRAAGDAPFLLRIDRPDGQPQLSQVAATMPPGLLARIGDVPPCAEAQAAAGTCPDASLVGSVRTTAGPGSQPLPVSGRVYLTGPYGGAPFGLSIVVPTAGQAGPFDLGTVVVRARITVDRSDAHVTVASDPMPTILRGIPLRVRSLLVAIDRPRFMLNPSSCRPMAVGVRVASTDGAAHEQRVPYRATGCGDLRQDQRIALRLTGRTETRPGRHPGLQARVTSRGPGTAGLRKVVVKLPLSLALDPRNAKALCTPQQRQARSCPAATVVGRATVRTVLREPLSGPVHFVEGRRRTASGRIVATLPKLWIPLSGGGVTIDVDADSSVDRRRRLVATFAGLPDAPLTSFDLRLNSGRHGILRIPPSRQGGTCRRDKLVDVELSGHNGGVRRIATRLAVAGCRSAKRPQAG